MVLVALPTQVAERNNTGNMLYGQGEYEAAMRAYEAAQVNAPDAPQAYYNAASALATMGRLRDAADALLQSLKTADENLIADAHFNLGNVYYQMARYNDAVEAFKQVLLLNPDDEAARYNYELALLRRMPTLTPTPQEQNTNPDEEAADPSPTPTPNPAGQDRPTATPTPPQDSPPDTQATPEEGDGGVLDSNSISTPTPSIGGPLTIEDVERRLDAIQENQKTLREFLQSASTPNRPHEKDW
jgi:tetratricopeptide (TPR) repeat protein